MTTSTPRATQHVAHPTTNGTWTKRQTATATSVPAILAMLTTTAITLNTRATTTARAHTEDYRAIATADDPLILIRVDDAHLLFNPDHQVASPDQAAEAVEHASAITTFGHEKGIGLALRTPHPVIASLGGRGALRRALYGDPIVEAFAAIPDAA